MRWIWIDHFEEFVSRTSATAVKAVSTAEDHVHDLYPGSPLFPDSLILEGLAQTGGILVGEANDFREKVVLAKIPQAVFHGHAAPGDVLRYHVGLAELRAEGAIVKGKVVRDGVEMAEAEIVFAHLDQARGAEGEADSENFVFTRDHLLGLLRRSGVAIRVPREAAENVSPAASDNGRE